MYEGGGVIILIPATGKEQELEIPKNVWVFQVPLAGIVGIHEERRIIEVLKMWKKISIYTGAFSAYKYAKDSVWL